MIVAGVSNEDFPKSCRVATENGWKLRCTVNRIIPTGGGGGGGGLTEFGNDWSE